MIHCKNLRLRNRISRIKSFNRWFYVVAILSCMFWIKLDNEIVIYGKCTHAQTFYPVSIYDAIWNSSRPLTQCELSHKLWAFVCYSVLPISVYLSLSHSPCLYLSAPAFRCEWIDKFITNEQLYNARCVHCTLHT